MNEEGLITIARYVRPLLIELAETVSLPTGILGVAFPGITIVDRHPVFAEYVGPDTRPEIADQNIRRDEAVRTINYTINRYHPLIRCLRSTGGDDDKCVILMRADALTSKGDETGTDFWEPLVVIFGGETNVPESIRIWRYWMTPKRQSAIYYLSHIQDSPIDSWNELSRMATLAGHSIRTGSLLQCVSQEVKREDADLFLNCLPIMLPAHEKNLFDLLRSRETYQRDARDVSFEVVYQQRNDRLVIQALRPGRQPREVVCLSPPAKGRMARIDTNWIMGPRNPSGHKMITTVLTLRKALAADRRKDYDAKVPWTTLVSFVRSDVDPPAELPTRHPNNKPSRTTSITSADIQTMGSDSFGVEGLSGDQVLEMKLRDSIDKRVMRGAHNWLVSHICRDSSTVHRIQFIHRSRFDSFGGRAYELTIPVTLDDSTRNSFKKANKSNWLRYLLAQVFDVQPDID